MRLWIEKRKTLEKHTLVKRFPLISTLFHPFPPEIWGGQGGPFAHLPASLANHAAQY